jgi:hypothetical protein
MAILQSLPGIVSGALGGLTDYACRAILLDYSDALRGLSGGAIAIQDRKATVMAATLAAIPDQGDKFSIGGRRWSVIKVGRDPAAATYDLQLRPD